MTNYTVESPQPLRIHIGKDFEIVLFDGKIIGMLQAFEFHYAVDALTLRTMYDCHGCFPMLQPCAPDKALSNSDFPLRIYAGQSIEEGHITPNLDVWFSGHHVSDIKKINIKLHAENKRLITIQFSDTLTPPRELIDALVDLGVEVIL